MNAPAHVMCVAAGGSVEDLWNLCEEMIEMLRERAPGVVGDAPTLHGFTAKDREGDRGLPRYCFHPSGEQDIEFRRDDLHEAMVAGAMYLARLLPDTDLWRRDG